MAKLKNLFKMGVGNLVGIGLISATAGAVNTIPAGTAKTISGITPALQSTALVGYNIKSLNPYLKTKKSPKFKI